MVNCVSCNSRCSKNNSLACDFCGSSFHFKCSEITREAIDLILAFNNLVFKCDTCLNESNVLATKVNNISENLSNAMGLLKTLKFEKSNKSLNSVNNIKTNDIRVTRSKATVSNPLIFNNNNASLKRATSAGDLPSSINIASVVGVTGEIMESANEVINSLDLSNSLVASTSSSNLNNAAMVASAANDVNPIINPKSAAVVPNTLNSGALINNKSGKAGNKRSNLIIHGTKINSDLDVAVGKRKWLHLSSFLPCVTNDDIINYLSKNASLNKDFISCFKLIKKDDSTALKHVNFKLGVPLCYADK